MTSILIKMIKMLMKTLVFIEDLCFSNGVPSKFSNCLDTVTKQSLLSAFDRSENQPMHYFMT